MGEVIAVDDPVRARRRRGDLLGQVFPTLSRMRGYTPAKARDDLLAGLALTAVLVPVGNGALISGIGSWLRAHSPRTRVVGVCAEAAPSMAISVYPALLAVLLKVDPAVASRTELSAQTRNPTSISLLIDT